MSVPISYLPRVWMGSQISSRLLPSKMRPLSAHIKLTENCQARCISCDYWKTRWQDSIDTDRAIRLVNEISGAGIRSLRLTGGEPLLRKDMFQVLKQAKTSSLKSIIIQTNGLQRLADNKSSCVCGWTRKDQRPDSRDQWIFRPGLGRHPITARQTGGAFRHSQ